MARIIAVANIKGGTGKSTIAVNLAAELAGPRRTVAVVDADAQGTATAWLAQGDFLVRSESLPLDNTRNALTQPYLVQLPGAETRQGRDRDDRRRFTIQGCGSLPRGLYRSGKHPGATERVHGEHIDAHRHDRSGRSCNRRRNIVELQIEKHLTTTVPHNLQ